jgi:hypothetical protein
MKIAAHVPDLMDRSKVAALGEVTFVADPAELPDVAAASKADVVVVDLSRPGVLDVLSRIDAHTVGFGRHTSPRAATRSSPARSSSPACSAARWRRAVHRAETIRTLPGNLASSSFRPTSGGRGDGIRHR